jgi:hypothetical protein
LVLIVSSRPTIAQSNGSNYILILASGFLCDLSDTTTCPATGKDASGNTFEMSGAGMFDAQSKSMKAAGTYIQKSPNGNALETGVWIASELVSFNSYGAVPGALPRQGMAIGSAAMGPRRMPMARASMPTGGLAVFRIQPLPLSGLPTMAVLQVNCALGDAPRERSLEGIRLTLERNHTQFSEEVSGRVMFLSMRPGGSTPAKHLQQEVAPETSEPPHN